jgi:hypothetical protein
MLGYPNYVVSNLGEVANIKTKRSLEGYYSNGYRRVVIRNNGKSINTNVSRAVLEAFYGPSPKNMEVDHKDTNRWNNCLDNLHWCTHKENMSNSITRTKMQKPHKLGKYYDDIPTGIQGTND